MAIRRRVAERISKVKKRAGLETPILGEVPLMAEILERFELPKGVIPAMARGKAYGETAGLWYRVRFPRPIYDPVVVCVGEARRGEIPRSKLVPTIPPLEKLLDIRVIDKLKKVLKERIPDLTIKWKWEIYIPTADDFKKLVRDFLGDWGAFNFMRDWIADGFGGFEYWIWDKLFRPRGLEKLNDLLETIRGRFNDRLEKIRSTFNTKLEDIDDRLDTLRSRVNDRLGKVGDGVDERFEKLRTGANDSFERLFPRLYEAWGLRRDMALTSLHIRNVTSSGFEFQSYGATTCYWLCIGRRR